MKKNYFLIILLFVLVLTPLLELKAAQGVSQLVTYDLSKENEQTIEKGTSLEEALAVLERKFNVLFLYRSHLLDKKTVSESEILHPNRELSDILLNMLRDSGLTYRQIGYRTIGIAPERRVENAFDAYQHTVAGRVIDAQTGEALPGVNVIIKDTNRGTSTDANGLFELTVETLQDTLVVSYIGYQEQEVPINGRVELNVSLEPQAIEGEELVVTALNILKTEESIGYSTQKIDTQELTVAQEPNIVNNLNGKVAGLTIFNSTDFFGNSDIQLRGENPLIVIDGIPNEDANLWAIDANNIESIDVLKGTSASALYGSLGRNGAIMINTKRGNQTGEDIFEVELNSSTTFQTDFIRVPEKQNQYGSGRNGQYRYIDGSGNGIEGFGFTWGPRLDQPDPSTESGFVEIVQYNSPIDPETGERVPIPWISRGENNMENFFRTGIVSSNSLSVTTGNENRNIRASISNKTQRGIIPNTSLQSSFLNLAGSYTHNDFRLDASMNYNKQSSDNVPEIAWSSQSLIYNLAMWTGSNIDVRDLKDYWVDGQEGVQQRHYSRAFYNNPHFIANEYNRGFYKDVVNSQITLSYEITDNFSILSRNGFNYFSEDQPEEEPKSFVRNFSSQRGNYRTRDQNNFNFSSDLVLDYNRQLNQDISLAAKLGGSSYYYNSRSSFLTTDGLVIPDFYSISNSLNAVDGSNFYTEYKKNSVYGIVNLDYNEMLYFEVTGRNDWVSTLPVENNSFFYPSVSGSFVVSEAFELPEFINFAKLRASWAKVANGDFGSNYAHIPTYNSGITWQNNNSLQFPGTLISSNLEPETSSSYEGGIDLSFLNGRLGIDFTYFESIESNNIVQVPVSVTSGYNSRLQNANEFEKRGFEIILNGVPFESQNFTWDFMANVGRSVTYIKKINIGDNIGMREVGDRLDDLYTTIWLSSPDGDYILNEDGFNIRDPFQRYVGPTGPDLTFGLQNTFRYKNMSLRLSIDGRLGGLMNSPTIREMYWNGTHPDLVGEDRMNSTQGIASYVAPGVVVTSGEVEYDADGNIVSDTRQFAPNSIEVNFENYMNSFHSRNYGNHWYSETFVKLREVNFTYRLPQSWIPQNWFSEATVSIVGRNLLMLADVRFLDPDSGTDSSLQTPSMRSVGFNFNIKF